MPTSAEVLFDVIKTFLARKTEQVILDHLKECDKLSCDSSWRNESKTKSSDCEGQNNDASVKGGCSLQSPPQFLPIVTLGKGERSWQFYLFDHLAAKGYCVIPEFSVQCPSVHDQHVDLLVVDPNAKTPVAAIELKHHSIHQSWNSDNLLKSLDADFDKRKVSTFDWGTAKQIRIITTVQGSQSIPLIQIGLLTAIYSLGSTLNHTVPFLRKYVLGGVNNAISITKNGGCTRKPNSSTRYNSVFDEVQPWWHGNSGNKIASYLRHYKQGCLGWGPEECFTLSPTGTPDFPVVGRVGYVCVMTK